MSKKISMAAVTLIAAILYGGIAHAHPELQSTEPAAGAATSSPRQIKITFNESVIPQFSGLQLKDQTGKGNATAKSTTEPTNEKRKEDPIPGQITPGDTTVYRHAVTDYAPRL